MTRFYIDTEFADTGSTIELISIGLVCEDGRELYLQSAEFDPSKANDWIKENVFPHLQKCEIDQYFSADYTSYGPNTNHTGIGKCRESNCPWRTRAQIRDEVKAFIDVGHEYLEDNGNPEFWSWCGSYDYVALCQLFGTMMDTPINWPHYIKDLQYILDERDVPDDWLPDQESGMHHALEDARHIKKLWGHIVRNDAWQ
jgi:hypothetical protein